MTSRSVGHAQWRTHVNGVNPPRSMRDWLTDNASLTQKLMARSTHFRVRRLRQERALCLADEFEMVALPRRACVQQREVLLQCDGRPVVYAHTIVPLSATAADWPFFSTLGERSLGSTLFGDPRVVQGALQYARLRAQHPLVHRASEALGGIAFESPLFARRCLYRRRNGVLLVTELFLPAITDLESPERASLLKTRFELNELLSFASMNDSQQSSVLSPTPSLAETGEGSVETEIVLNHFRKT